MLVFKTMTLSRYRAKVVFPDYYSKPVPADTPEVVRDHIQIMPSGVPLTSDPDTSGLIINKNIYSHKRMENGQKKKINYL